MNITSHIKVSITKFFRKITETPELADKYIAQKVFLAIRNSIFKNEYKILKIQDIKLKQDFISSIILNKYESYSYRPMTLKKESEKLKVVCNEVYLFTFKNSIVNASSSSIMYDNCLYIDIVNKDEVFNEGFIRYHGKKNAIVELYNTEEIEEGFFLAGNGCSNWYHWIIEILPKAYFALKGGINTFLVSEDILHIPSMQETLNIFTKGYDIDIVYLKKTTNYMVKKLYYINHINYMPFNPLNKKGDASAENVYFRKDVLHLIKSKLSERMKSNFDKCNIYMERGITRQPKNAVYVEQLMRNSGFKLLDLSKISFLEQEKFMSNASKVVGVSGAAWANIIFMEPGTSAVCIVPDNMLSFSVFSSIAGLMSIKLINVYYKSVGSHHAGSGFEINTRDLELAMLIV